MCEVGDEVVVRLDFRDRKGVVTGTPRRGVVKVRVEGEGYAREFPEGQVRANVRAL